MNTMEKIGSQLISVLNGLWQYERGRSWRLYGARKGRRQIWSKNVKVVEMFLMNSINLILEIFQGGGAKKQLLSFILIILYIKIASTWGIKHFGLLEREKTIMNHSTYL